MFKLIKILNSGVNVPEPKAYPTSGDVALEVGSALVLRGGLLRSAEEVEMPEYVSASAAKKGETTILAYEIFENMLFETPILASPEGLVIGEKLTLTREATSAVGVSSTTTAGVATIHDLCGAEKAGDKIVVQFKKEIN